MKNQLILGLAGVLALGIASAAQANTVTLSLGAPLTTGTVLETFDELTAAQGSLDGSSGSANEGNTETVTLANLNNAVLSLSHGQIVQYSLVSEYAAPYSLTLQAQEGTPYLAIYSGGSATFNLVHPTSYFSLQWGSVDTYNTLAFYDGNTLLGSFTGQDIANLGNLTTAGGPGSGTNWGIDGTVYANFVSTSPVTTIVATTSGNSFELDNVRISAVPEPATWAMMLIGFAGIGIAGMRLRRRSAKALA